TPLRIGSACTGGGTCKRAGDRSRPASKGKSDASCCTARLRAPSTHRNAATETAGYYRRGGRPPPTRPASVRSPATGGNARMPGFCRGRLKTSASELTRRSRRRCVVLPKRAVVVYERRCCVRLGVGSFSGEHVSRGRRITESLCGAPRSLSLPERGLRLVVQGALPDTKHVQPWPSTDI
ncbi:hypothetical protein HPB47_002481, partial [Ixodes persulcatus]